MKRWIQVIGALALVVIAFVVTQMLLDNRDSGDVTTQQGTTPPEQPSSPPDTTRATTLTDLPKLDASAFGAPAWESIMNVNVRRVSGTSVVRGQPLLEVTTLPTENIRRMGIQFSGLPTDRTYRVTAWVKPKSETRILLEVRDGGTVKYGLADFDLEGRAVQNSRGDVQNATIESGSDGWLKLGVDLPSTNGFIIANTYFAGANAPAALTFGGIAVEERK